MIVFCHVPKTAGTALRVALGEHLQLFNTYPRIDPTVVHPVQPVPEGTELIFGHFWAGLYEGEHILLLRDPIERAVSNYFHFLKAAEKLGSNLLMQAIGRGEVTLRDWVVGNGPGDAIWPNFPQERPWNMMSRWVAGIPDPQQWSRPDLWDLTIKSFLKQFRAISNDPQKLFDHLGLEGEVPQYNLNPMNEGPGALDGESREILMERNRIDYQLWEAVVDSGGLMWR